MPCCIVASSFPWLKPLQPIIIPICVPGPAVTLHTTSTYAVYSALLANIFPVMLWYTKPSCAGGPHPTQPTNTPPPPQTHTPNTPRFCWGGWWGGLVGCGGGGGVVVGVGGLTITFLHSMTRWSSTHRPTSLTMATHGVCADVTM